MPQANLACRTWYDDAYAREGFDAQRRYPNEELLRFFGRHYFSLPRPTRGAIRVLEVGCGSGANLWMIAREGFAAHGIDHSEASLRLCRAMLAQWDAAASLACADMTALPYCDRSFDVIADVFSAYCLDEAGFARFLDEVARLLRPGGRFFSYTPSKASDAFRDPGPSRLLDASTLDGIAREGAPYRGSDYPFRFASPSGFATAIAARGLAVLYNETVGRSYRNGKEYFEFLVLVAGAPARAR
jgi:SAM-dependent methyltransferase